MSGVMANFCSDLGRFARTSTAILLLLAAGIAACTTEPQAPLRAGECLEDGDCPGRLVCLNDPRAGERSVYGCRDDGDCSLAQRCELAGATCRCSIAAGQAWPPGESAADECGPLACDGAAWQCRGAEDRQCEQADPGRGCRCREGRCLRARGDDLPLCDLHAAAGAEEPVFGSRPGCTPSGGGVELCNGQDDDCDGQTDEGYKDSGIFRQGQGGTLSILKGRVQVQIPPGALRSDVATPLTLRALVQPGSRVSGPTRVFALEPAGIVFAEPVLLELDPALLPAPGGMVVALRHGGEPLVLPRTAAAWPAGADRPAGEGRNKPGDDDEEGGDRGGERAVLSASGRFGAASCLERGLNHRSPCTSPHGACATPCRACGGAATEGPCGCRTCTAVEGELLWGECRGEGVGPARSGWALAGVPASGPAGLAGASRSAPHRRRRQARRGRSCAMAWTTIATATSARGPGKEPPAAAWALGAGGARVRRRGRAALQQHAGRLRRPLLARAVQPARRRLRRSDGRGVRHRSTLRGRGGLPRGGARVRRPGRHPLQHAARRLGRPLRAGELRRLGRGLRWGGGRGGGRLRGLRLGRVGGPLRLYDDRPPRPGLGRLG